MYLCLCNSDLIDQLFYEDRAFVQFNLLGTSVYGSCPQFSHPCSPHLRLYVICTELLGRIFGWFRFEYTVLYPIWSHEIHRVIIFGVGHSVFHSLSDKLLCT
jgi:hypothetical protein